MGWYEEGELGWFLAFDQERFVQRIFRAVAHTRIYMWNIVSYAADRPMRRLGNGEIIADLRLWLLELGTDEELVLQLYSDREIVGAVREALDAGSHRMRGWTTQMAEVPRFEERYPNE